MNELWNKFESWLAENWPEGLCDLNPPATEEDILKLESGLGVKLPSDFIACLRVHNGQTLRSGTLLDNAEFLSTEAILSQWTVWKELLDGGDFDGIHSEPDPGIKDDWWNAKWIPFTHNGGGDHHCIDLDPNPGGSHGQVISMWHDMGDRNIKGKSFQDWFQRYVEDVLNGQYVFSEEYGGLTRVDEL